MENRVDSYGIRQYQFISISPHTASYYEMAQFLLVNFLKGPNYLYVPGE